MDKACLSRESILTLRQPPSTIKDAGEIPFLTAPWGG